MWEDNDFDAIGLSRFVGKLQQYEYELESDRRLIEPRFFTVERSPMLAPLEPSDVVQVEIQDNRCSIKCSNPAALGLGILLHYRRLG
jgi:hypothetical protein